MKTLYRNAKIFTSNDDMPYADAMIVEDGIIKSIGKETDLDIEGCESEDLNGLTVIPGLTDCHTHGLLLADYSKQISCLPPEISSIEELIKVISETAEDMGPGQWIKGWGYDEGKLLEGRAPTRWDLDKGSSDHPIFIARTCVHIAAVNSRALELAGIDRNTPDPPGGHIVRDENGEPNGILQENARNLVIDIMPKQTIEEKVGDLKDLGDLLLSQGITGFTDLGSFDEGDVLDFYKAAEETGLKQEVSIYYFWDKASETGEYTINEQTMDPANQIHVQGLKLVSDGSISGHTAYVDVPYLGTDDMGIYELDEDLFKSAIEFCKENSCQLAVHAMGGLAIEKVVDRVVQEKNWMKTSAPYVRMEHITEPKEESIEKASLYGIAFAMQPIFQYCEIESYLKNLGPERTKLCYPIRHMLDKGVNIGLSTDAPATSWAVPSDPWPNLKAAVTRVAYDGTDCGKNEAIDIETAIRLYTKGSAEICGFEKLGMLVPGYKANFAVLSDDIFEMAGEDLDTVKVLRTYVKGELAYQR